MYTIMLSFLLGHYANDPEHRVCLDFSGNNQIGSWVKSEVKNCLLNGALELILNWIYYNPG